MGTNIPGQLQQERKVRLRMARQLGLIARAQAKSDGMSDGAIDYRMAKREWIRVFPGVLRDAVAPCTWQQRLLAACLWAGQAVASHRAAAALLQLDGVAPGLIEITTPVPKRSPAPDVIIHRSNDMPSKDVARVGPIPVTTPTRTLIDLGAVVDEETLEIALDCALRRRMTSIARLGQRMDELAGKGRSGVGVLRKVLDQRDPAERPPESVLETKTKRVLRILKRARLPLPVCQHVIGRFRVDFAYPNLKIAIEADSAKHHLNPRAREHDRKRRNYLTARGWLVLHFTWEDITMHPERVMAEVSRALSLRLQDAR